MKKMSCSLIVFNDRYIGHILLTEEYNGKLCLPNFYVEENENLLGCVKRIGKEFGITTHNELLTYIIEEKDNCTYIFICNTNDEFIDDEFRQWCLGNEENLNALDEPNELKQDLINKFKNGFLLDGTKEIIVEEK